MSKNYEPPKTTRQLNHKTNYQPCTSERHFYTNHMSKQQQQSERVARLQLKKSVSCSTLKNEFVQILISRMRGVPRPSNHSKLQEVNEKLVYANLKLQKSKQKLEAYKQSFQPAQSPIFQPQQKKEGKRRPAEQGDRLRSEIGELIKQNKKLFQEIKGLQCQLFYQKQKVEHLSSELQSKNQLIQQLQYEIVVREKAQKQQVKCNIRDSYTFQISKTVDQFILAAPSFEKISLLKANTELMTLKKQIFALQKGHQTKYAQLSRIKNEEIQHLRRNFFATLKHYKKMIIKCTSKKNEDPNHKQSDQVMESTLMESSSILQI